MNKWLGLSALVIVLDQFTKLLAVQSLTLYQAIPVLPGFNLKGHKAEQRWLPVALAFVLGGAIGNVIDRIYLGYVVDFIEVYYSKYYWPAFNIVDSAITVGAIMLIIDAIWLNHPENDKN